MLLLSYKEPKGDQSSGVIQSRKGNDQTSIKHRRATNHTAAPPPALAITSTDRTTDTTPLINGTAEAGSRITLSIGGATYITTASSVGSWSIDTGTPPSRGTLLIGPTRNQSLRV